MPEFEVYALRTTGASITQALKNNKGAGEPVRLELLNAGVVGDESQLLGLK